MDETKAEFIFLRGDSWKKTKGKGNQPTVISLRRWRWSGEHISTAGTLSEPSNVKPERRLLFHIKRSAVY